MVAGLHTPSSGIGAQQIRLDHEWYSLVFIPYFQVVGCAFLASEAMDASIYCSTHQKHHTSILDPSGIEWHGDLIKHHSAAFVVVCVSVVLSMKSGLHKSEEVAAA